MTPIFRGHVSKEGRLTLEAPFQFHAHVEKHRDRDVEVIVRRVKSQRSNEQNAWAWGVAYPLLAETLGYDMHEREDLHYALIAKCFGTHFDKRLKAEVPNKRSSQLSTQEFSDYMEWLLRFAAQELHCIIPLPNEVIPA